MPLPPVISKLTGLNDATLENEGVSLDEAITRTLSFIGDSWIVGHNAAFDIRFLQSACQTIGFQPPSMKAIDTILLSRSLLSNSVPDFRLQTLARHFQITEQQTHRALPDARITAYLYLKLNENHSAAK